MFGALVVVYMLYGITARGEAIREKEQMKGRWKVLIGMIIGVVISLITLCTVAIILFFIFISGGSAEIVKDSNKYEETIAGYHNLHSGLITFPEIIPQSARDIDFYSYYREPLGAPVVEIFLQCTYNEEDYHAELQRLEHAQKTFKYGTKVTNLMKEEDGRYPYTAYIAIDGFENSYEYAMLTGERQITYIHKAYKESGDLKKISTSFIPSDFDSRMYELNEAEAFNIYLEDITVVDGEIWGWYCDY